MKPDHVRLSVNLAPPVADTLRDYAERHGMTVTDATRRAVALYALEDTTSSAGGFMAVVEGDPFDGGRIRRVVLS